MTRTLMGVHTQPGGLQWKRTGTPWRVIVDVCAHWLHRRRLIPFRLLAFACKVRGPHSYRYGRALGR